MMERSYYVVRLSWNMVCAIVDIHWRYAGAESARFKWPTLRALERRGLVHELPVAPPPGRTRVHARLTKLGRAYVAAMAEEYELRRDEYDADEEAA